VVDIREGKTTRPHLLTAGHRTYGQGEHPQVGWDRKGDKVVFGSHLLGNLNVCVATIHKARQDAASANHDGLGRETPIAHALWLIRTQFTESAQ
jgi:hypothetical protein